MRTLCFGEAIVDLICHRPVRALAEADAFVPHPGGVSANVAVTAARGGSAVSLAGGVGSDPWGAWLHDRLAAEHVDLRWFGRAEGQGTSLTFVILDAAGEPTYELYGDGIAAAVSALNGRLLEGVEACDALFFTSNTLAGSHEAELTMAARERALELGRPIVFDPNVRLGRWEGSSGRAAAAAGDCVPGAFLVKCNAAEGRMLTGESEPEAAADSLLAAGAQHVIVTSGEHGAILRGGGLRHHVRAFAADVVSTTGAGDVFLGTLLARLGTTDFSPPTLAVALPEAAQAAGQACERWGALE
jgi:sugar/nucleoside kinase (ribokinase family)